MVSEPFLGPPSTQKMAFCPPSCKNEPKSVAQFLCNLEIWVILLSLVSFHLQLKSREQENSKGGPKEGLKAISCFVESKLVQDLGFHKSRNVPS